MSEHRHPDYLDHMQQAGIMNLIIIGEAVTKVMDGYAEFAQAHGQVQYGVASTTNTRSPNHMGKAKRADCCFLFFYFKSFQNQLAAFIC